MAEAKTFRNPIIPGFAPDPSVVFVDGVFYLATSSFHVFPGIPIYTSTDLQEWKHIGLCPSQYPRMASRAVANNVPQRQRDQSQRAAQS